MTDFRSRDQPRKPKIFLQYIFSKVSPAENHLSPSGLVLSEQIPSRWANRKKIDLIDFKYTKYAGLDFLEK
jgi:hypothetical protein